MHTFKLATPQFSLQLQSNKGGIIMRPNRGSFNEVKSGLILSWEIIIRGGNLRQNYQKHFEEKKDQSNFFDRLQNRRQIDRITELKPN